MNTVEQARSMVQTFLATPFSGDPRHVRRITMVAHYDESGTLPPLPSA